MMRLPFLEILGQYAERPSVLILLLPALILLAFIIFRHKEESKSKKGLRKYVFWSRAFIFLALILAFSHPQGLYNKLLGEKPSAIFLLDNSSSYDIFPRQKGLEFYEELAGDTSLDLALFGHNTQSPLGDELASLFIRGNNVLLISDGQVVSGKSLGDAALEAEKNGVAVNVLRYEPSEKDYSIVIDGPSTTSSGVETEYSVQVLGSPVVEHDISVDVDGAEILTKRSGESITFTRTFTEGYHTLKAEMILENDHFKENNIFYKTVKVIEKPQIALVSNKESALPQLLQNVYETSAIGLEQTQSLDPYYTLILDDLSAQEIGTNAKAVQQFVSEGNGLVVFGGLNSYDKGGYKDSALESILPVDISGSGKKEGFLSVVIIMDLSGSSGTRVVNRYDPDGNLIGQVVLRGDEKINLEKALAISVIKAMRNEVMLGIVGFDSSGVQVIREVDFLIGDRSPVTSKVASLTTDKGGESFVGDGLGAAHEMLLKSGGSRNVILFSDGDPHRSDEVVCIPPIYDPRWEQQGAKGKEKIEEYKTKVKECEEKAYINRMTRDGISVFTVGVGEDENENFMQLLAEQGNGQYFKATERNKMKILFGNEDGEENKDYYSIILKDRKHFITENLNLNAKVYGFNEASPKTNAQLLAVTDKGDPLVVVWRYGLGRVVSVLTDDGSLYAGDLLSKQNSKLLLRAISWASGDPERKKETFLSIPDGKMGEDTEILYKGNQPPESEIPFTLTQEKLYKATISPEAEGFHTLLGATYAVNRPRELDYLGFNEELLELASSTGGLVFDGSNKEEILAALEKQKPKSTIQTRDYQWPFVLLALILFLIEVVMRKTRFRE